MPVSHRFYSVALSLSALFLLGGCGSNSNVNAPDVSGVKLSVQTMRFDKDMYAIDTNHIADGLKQLKQKYPDFMDFFLDTVMNYGLHNNYDDTNTAIRTAVRECLTYKDYVQLQDTIDHYYPNTKDIDETITNGYKYARHYIPTFPVPAKIIYTNHLLIKIPPVFCVDQNISCICLDMFLGPQFPFYRSVGVPDYTAPHLRKNYIPVALFRTAFESVYHYPQQEQTLLDLMIQQGKEQYFLHQVMPGTPDSVLFGFTGTQVKWCEANETAIYNYFVQNNLLYNKRDAEVRSYVVDGPFAHNMGSASEPGTTPGNIGSWMGYRVVASYMSNNVSLPLKDLFTGKIEGGKFLQDSRYKPK